MALDDLVEALAGQPGAAVVEEQARLEPVAGEPRAAALQVGRRARGRRWSRSGPAAPWSPCRGRAGCPCLEVDVADLEAGRLGGAQAAGVHDLQQRAVAQRRRLGAAGLLEQAGDLVAGEDLRELAALARGAQVRGRVVLEQRLRGAGGGRRSAGRRPCAAAWRARPAGARRRPPASAATNSASSACVERRGRRRRVRCEVRAELQQVGAVGLERVARQAALELEVGEEVEHEVLERLEGSDDGHGAWFAAGGRAPCRCNAAFRRPELAPCSRARPMIVLESVDSGDQRLELGQRARPRRRSARSRGPPGARRRRRARWRGTGGPARR